MSEIALNINKVKKAIEGAAEKAGRKPDEIKLIAISKTIETERIKEAIDAGLNTFGENRIQEAQGKIDELPDSIEWHLVGHLQSNKVKYIFDKFALIHSVDSLQLAEEIDKKAETKGKRVNILIQINVSGEKSKFGVPLDNAIPVVTDICKLKNPKVRGLMTIPPYAENPEDSRVFYKKLKSLKMELEGKNIILPELSMGMSNDYEVAIEEGATLVRVGSAIFGSRL